MSEDLDRRISRIEREQERMEEVLRELVLSTTRIGDLLEQQRAMSPKIDALTNQVHDLQISVSNAQLVQRGVVWLGGIIGSSAVVMAMSFLFRSSGA